MPPSKIIRTAASLQGIGTVVNRVLRCLNPHCAGIIDTKEGPAPVRFAQLQYQHKPAPECPYCSHIMAIESVSARKSGHTSKGDEHRVMDRLQEQVFSHAEGTGHRLAEGGRTQLAPGDTARVEMDPNAKAYLEQTTAMADKANVPTGFGYRGAGSVAKQIQKIKGVAADPSFARQTVADGAMLPMSALAAATGNVGMTQNDGTKGIIGGRQGFWRQPTGSVKIR